MSVQSSSSSINSSVHEELHYLIAKYLSNGPCAKAGQVLIEELEQNKMIPHRLNWLGESFKQDFKTYDAKLSHIRPDHLITLLEKLIKDSETVRESRDDTSGLDLISTRARSLLVRRMESFSSSGNMRLQQQISSTLFRRSPSQKMTGLNCVQTLFGREMTSRSISSEILKPSIYSDRIQVACRTLGHLAAVYCVLIDMTGKYIFTGADDKLVKIWSFEDGRLLFTLRGCTSEITDLAVNNENTLLATSCNDKLIRVWCLRTGAPLATLNAHSGSVTAIFFCPTPRSRSCIRYLASTSTDGSCAFWSYTEEPGQKAKFAPLPTVFMERMRPGHAQMLCASFSAGGVFMAAGSADNNVRVYYMLGSEGPERILEVENNSDRVDSISWAHRGVRFISGSRDGTALVWHYERQQWRFVRILCNKQAIGDPPVNNSDPKQKLRVTMVGWNADDTLVVTAISNNLIKVWNPVNGNCVRILRSHKDEVYCVEPNPVNPRVLCTAGHDGNIFVWDIGTLSDPDLESGKQLFHYHNDFPDYQGFGSIFDVKWAPDGFSFAATDSHGHLIIFKTTKNEKFAKLPNQLFFHTDYRPLSRDAISNITYDEQTQVEPHLMPPPFLVDVEGNPYPPASQRLVPGRENCIDEQLIPNVAVYPEGIQEVIEGVPAQVVQGQNQNPRSNIEELIAQLAAARGVAGDAANGNQENRAGEARGIADRRSGEVEGIRQSTGDWQTGNVQGLVKTRRIVSGCNPSQLLKTEQVRHAHADEEEQYYQKQKKLPPLASDLAVNVESFNTNERSAVRSRRIRQLAAVAAEQRRLNEMTEMQQTAREGVARPNPPQQEISLPQNPPARRTGVHTLNRRRRRARYRIIVPEQPDQVPPSDHESSESSFTSSDVSSSTSSSEYSDSDWGGAPTASPKKPLPSTSDKKRTTRNSSNSPPQVKEEPDSDADYEEPQPGPSSQIRAQKVKVEPPKPRPVRKARRVDAVETGGGLDEIEEKYRPSDWLSELMPRKSPYFPQLGDDLVYFRQGHNNYLEEVKSKAIYPMSKKYLKSLPWMLNPLLPTEVPVRVVGINFEIKPPRVVRLKLAVTDWETGELTGSNINNVVYHDVSSIVDFLILRQLYDKSMRHKWNTGDRFRCLIDRVWWIGTINSVQPFSSNFPDSKFLCYSASWASGDVEKLSPWDIEVIPDDFEIPDDETKEEGIPASEEDVHSDQYEPSVRDWPPFGHQDAECQRIATLIEDVMGLAFAEQFLTPVDLKKYPEYSYEIAYPIDLNTIKTRLEHRFYRRLDALKFDIKHIALNAEQFNRPLTDIVKKARIIRDLCLQISLQPELTEVTGTYHTLTKNFKWEKVIVDKSEPAPSTSTSSANIKQKSIRAFKSVVIEPLARSSQTNGRRLLNNLRPRKIIRRGGRRSSNGEVIKTWQESCKELLDRVWQSRDSEPFRKAVDPTEYPDYYVRIDTPMDLMSVKEDLLGGNYGTPHEFARDMRLIFSNSKIYNTDKHSRIYIMTVRLSSLFECNMNPIFDDYKCRRSRARKHDNDFITATPNKASSTNGSRLRYPRRSASNTPRKNPKRSAATRNPYVYQEESNDSSGLEEEPVADGDQYHDHRRKRRRSSQMKKATPNTKKRNLSSRRQTTTQPDDDQPPTLRPTRQVKKLVLDMDEETDDEERKNPKRSAATRNAHVYQEESNDSALEEEPVADEDQYHDHRRKRRRSSQMKKATQRTRKRNLSSRRQTTTQPDNDQPPTLRPTRQVKKLVSDIDEETDDEENSDESSGEEEEVSEEEQVAQEEEEDDEDEEEDEEAANYRKGRKLRRQSNGKAENFNKRVTRSSRTTVGNSRQSRYHFEEQVHDLRPRQSRKRRIESSEESEEEYR